MQDTPKVTIVTVVKNAAAVIEDTIKSVINQDYPNIEYIVVDGLSTDSTPSIIREYDQYIDTYVQEEDQGIYDAMNKAAAIATGDWIIFMNAGDQFYRSNTLSKIKVFLMSDADIILGGCEKILTDELETRRFHSMPGLVTNIWRQIPTSHQSTLVRLTCQQDYQFDLSYQWCADHDLLSRLYRDNKKFISTQNILCYFDCSGGQSKDLILYIQERWKLSYGLVPKYKRHIYYGFELFVHIVWGSCITLIKKILPTYILLRVRRFRNTIGINT